MIQSIQKRFVLTTGCFFLHFLEHMLGGGGENRSKLKLYSFLFRCLKILDTNLNWILVGKGFKNSEKSKNHSTMKYITIISMRLCKKLRRIYMHAVLWLNFRETYNNRISCYVIKSFQCPEQISQKERVFIILSLLKSHDFFTFIYLK